MKKVFILLGHPNSDDTFCKSLVDMYESGAREAGHDVRRVNMADMQFDADLHKGYKTIQDLEPDLITFQENIEWCEHFVVIYPTWWTSMPAKLKGLFDRAWVSKFAFSFKPNGTWNKLLSGRTAHIFTTMGASTFLEYVFFGDVTKLLKNNILKFAGFAPIKTTWIGNAEKMKPKVRESVLQKIKKLGSCAK